MNSRNKESHEIVIDQIKKLSNAINDPTPDKLNVILKAIGFVRREYKKPLFSNIEMFPNIGNQYLERMVMALNIDGNTIIHDIQSIDNPRQYVKKIAITNDPYLVISNFMKTDMLPKDTLEDDTLKLWTDILSSDIDNNMEVIKKILTAAEGRSTVEIIKNISKYIGIIVIVCGTILMNYIICMIGIGLIAIDISIDKYMKESADDSVLASKNYPYVVSGSYPMIHVDREIEFNDITTQDSSSFTANNLPTLITNVFRYIDNCAINTIVTRRDLSYDVRKHSFDHQIITQLRAIIAFTSETITEYDVYAAKKKILNLSNLVVDYDFHMDTDKRARWCDEFLNTISSGCQELAAITRMTNRPVDLGSLVQMYEIICLQIWDAFINQNHVKKAVATKNEYLTVNVCDDTNSIVQTYTTLPPVTVIPSVNNSQLLINDMLESIGSNVNIMIEATQSQDDQINQVSDSFKKRMDSTSNIVEQLRTKALPWVKDNIASMKDNAKKIYNEDSAILKRYTYNPNNISAAMAMLNDINTAITSNYASIHEKNMTNVNNIIIKNFPSLSKLDQNKPIPIDMLVNTIASGGVNDIKAEAKVAGSELASMYTTMINYLSSGTASQFIDSDIIKKLVTSVTEFRYKINQVSKLPMKESIDDIFSMMEETTSGTNSPAVITGNKTQPETTNKDQKQSEVVSSVKVNNSSVDAVYIRHATEVAAGVINILTSMTLDAYNLCSALYPTLSSRESK